MPESPARKLEKVFKDPRYLYAYVLIKTLVVVLLLLALAGREGQNVVYMEF